MRWIGLLALVACTSGTDDAGDGVEPMDTSPQDTVPEVVEDTSATLDVVLVDADGAPVVNAPVRFCRGDLCRVNNSDDQGRFGFDEVVVDWHSLEVIGPQGTPGLATAFAPVRFDTDESRTIDLVMPPLGPEQALTNTATPLQVGDGLQIEVALGDLEPPAFVDPATAVAGVRLTEAQWVPVDDQEGTVVAQWFLEPFDHTPSGNLPATFTNDYALEDGTQLRVVVGDYLTSRWLDAGTLTVTAGELEGTVNLPVTSTVVLLDVTPAN